MIFFLRILKNYSMNFFFKLMTILKISIFLIIYRHKEFNPLKELAGTLVQYRMSQY